MFVPDFPDWIECHTEYPTVTYYNSFFPLYQFGLEEGSYGDEPFVSYGSGLIIFNQDTGVLVADGNSCEGFEVGSTTISDVPGYSIANTASSGGTSYTIDVGSSIMLGGILAFMIAYWLVGLVRYKHNQD